MIGKAIGFCLLLCSQVCAGEALTNRFSRDVIFDAQAEQALVAVPLDAEVYAVSATDFSDLRLIDSRNEETPYWLQKISGHKTVTKRLPVHIQHPKLKIIGTRTG